jgi:hypothetical protein
MHQLQYSQKEKFALQAPIAEIQHFEDHHPGFEREAYSGASHLAAVGRNTRICEHNRAPEQTLPEVLTNLFNFN